MKLRKMQPLTLAMTPGSGMPLPGYDACIYDVRVVTHILARTPGYSQSS